jgi:hypothetical protein
MYTLIRKNKIDIGKHLISFPTETNINKVLSSEMCIWFNTSPSEEGLDWSKTETHQIWRNRCEYNPSELFCYGIDGILKWKFSESNVVGFGKIVPELKKEEEFLSSVHYRKYIEKFMGKELLEVYAGDFRYVLDANTGEVYDKMESR